MVLVGHSAGAHLVMQVLADPQFMRDAGLNRTVAEVVKAAVGISGVYNIVRIANTAIYGDLVVRPISLSSVTMQIDSTIVLLRRRRVQRLAIVWKSGGRRRLPRSSRRQGRSRQFFRSRSC